MSAPGQRRYHPCGPIGRSVESNTDPRSAGNRRAGAGEALRLAIIEAVTVHHPESFVLVVEHVARHGEQLELFGDCVAGVQVDDRVFLDRCVLVMIVAARELVGGVLQIAAAEPAVQNLVFCAQP